MSGERVDVREASGTTYIVLGAFSVAMGLGVVFTALGWIRVDPDSLRAPRWVIGLSGGVFVLVGGLILYYAVRNTFFPTDGPDGDGASGRRRGGFYVAGWLVGGLAVTAMAVVGGWIAFGPGERQFSGTIGLGGLKIWGTTLSNEAVGRAVFGVGTVLTGAFAVWGWIYGIRRLAARRAEDAPRTEEDAPRREEDAALGEEATGAGKDEPAPEEEARRRSDEGAAPGEGDAHGRNDADGEGGSASGG